ncbi:unnamed protein product, partial [Meganyctiphanes norvegica]
METNEFIKAILKDANDKNENNPCMPPGVYGNNGPSNGEYFVNGGDANKMKRKMKDNQFGGNGANGPSDVDEKGKMFVGGLSWETTQESLQQYFSRFGELTDCVVMKNNETGRSRGFGFITFGDFNNVDVVLKTGPHKLDGRNIDPKACNPRSMQKNMSKGLKVNSSNYKVFLGGLPSDLNETDLRNFFSSFGNVADVMIMFDQEKKKSRGFGFLSFETEEAVDRAVAEHFVNINGKQVEVKRAEPRNVGKGNDQSESPSSNQWGMYNMSPGGTYGANNSMTPPSAGAPQGQMMNQNMGQDPYQGWGTYSPQGYPPQGYGAPPPQPQGYPGWGPAAGQQWQQWGMPGYGYPPSAQQYGNFASPYGQNAPQTPPAAGTPGGTPTPTQNSAASPATPTPNYSSWGQYNYNDMNWQNGSPSPAATSFSNGQYNQATPPQPSFPPNAGIKNASQ